MIEETWLREIFLFACEGQSSLEGVANALGGAAKTLLPREVSSELLRNCPESVKLPGGRVKDIEYFENADPIVRLKLQDAFGWREHPTILMGKLKLRIELLAPNQRPLQITQDLLGFWKGSYCEVRKDMRARYPRHDWPEDPLTFDPQRDAKAIQRRLKTDKTMQRVKK